MPHIFFYLKGGGLGKNTLMRGVGGMEKKSEIGGFMQFSNYTAPKPTSSPPHPIKNKRSLTFVDREIHKFRNLSVFQELY